MATNLFRRLSQAVFGLITLLIPVGISAQDCIKLLVPLPSGEDCLPGGSTPFDVMNAYFQEMYPWIVGTAAGVAILWCVFSAAQMIFYAGNESESSTAKQHFIHAVMGLFLIVFSAMIMNFINPAFYQ